MLTLRRLKRCDGGLSEISKVTEVFEENVQTVDHLYDDENFVVLNLKISEQEIWRSAVHYTL